MYSKYESVSSDPYNSLCHYAEDISKSFTVRVYSDKTVSVSGYIGEKHIHLEGAYNLVLCCIKQLHWELKGAFT